MEDDIGKGGTENTSYRARDEIVKSGKEEGKVDHKGRGKGTVYPRPCNYTTNELTCPRRKKSFWRFSSLK